MELSSFQRFSLTETPLFPASGRAAVSFKGLHRERDFQIVLSKSHWWKPLAILCCLVNIVVADTFGNFTYTDNGTSITITDYPPYAVGDVVIPQTINGKPVVAIGQSAFETCYGVTSVTIPPSVTSIGAQAFYYCTLNSITIPNSVTSIGNQAFLYSGIQSITIPNSVTSIGEGMFARSGLQSITLPASITSIGAGAFAWCSLAGITIPDSVTSIGNGAFAGCAGLNTITIPDAVTSVGDSAFSDCIYLTGVIMSPNITRIGEYTFSRCYNLSGISIPPGVTSIGDEAFSNSYGLKSVIIPPNVTSIGSRAFADCGNLTHARFRGNAPTMATAVFDAAASGFTVYFSGNATNFSTPIWQGYPAFPAAPPQFANVPPSGTAGSPYHHVCAAVGGVPAAVFMLTSGALPPGLFLSGDGLISGTPTTPGSFTGTITASNGFSPDASQNFAILINQYQTLSVNSSNGTVSGGGIYLLNATATATANPSPGYLFTCWTGDATGTGNPVSVLMNSNKTITASFGPDTNDTDNDGLTNYREIVELGTNPGLEDTDGDGVKDGLDGLPLDPTETLDSDHDGIGDNVETDDDNDGYSDLDELNIHGTNPKRVDSDGDGLSDPAELQTHLTNPNIADTDADGLNDGAEVNTYGTLPKVADSDGDGFLDGYEVLTGKLPLDPLDKPALVAVARTAIEFVFPAAIGKIYRIEASIDLVTWGAVESGIVGTGGQIQRFYSILNVPKRYFRVEVE